MLLIDPHINAKQAASLGLLSEVVPGDQLLERTHKIANRLVQGTSTSIAGSKALMNDALFPNLEDQMQLETQRIIFQSGTEDFLAHLKEFLGEESLPQKGTVVPEGAEEAQTSSA